MLQLGSPGMPRTKKNRSRQKYVLVMHGGVYHSLILDWHLSKVCNPTTMYYLSKFSWLLLANPPSDATALPTRLQESSWSWSRAAKTTWENQSPPQQTWEWGSVAPNTRILGSPFLFGKKGPKYYTHNFNYHLNYEPRDNDQQDCSIQRKWANWKWHVCNQADFLFPSPGWDQVGIRLINYNLIILFICL